MGALEELSKKTVSYYSDEDVALHCLCGPNPMRPLRVKLTNELVSSYGLDRKMKMHRPRQLSYEELNMFHADEYVDFLSKVTPRNIPEYKTQMDRFNLGLPGEADCPVFEGVFKYCQLYSGGSRDAALNLMNGESSLAFNWSGGMYHAKRAEASGFCYVNDIVLAILELLKQYHRVLYVDIDIHHGDGVEEAFYLTDRVMTVSFHKYGDFFPGTGSVEDIGFEGGHNYSLNVPLQEGMDDESYAIVYEPIMADVMARYQPDAIVVCAGADSLSGDRLGCFNLSLQGHSACLEMLAGYNVPLLVLGGGGYTMRNVSRCWMYETARLQGVDPDDELPENFLDKNNYYMDTRKLRIHTSNMMNLNSRAYLHTIRDKCLANLQEMQPPSGAALSHQPAPGILPDRPEGDPDVRGGGAEVEAQRVVKDGYDSDEEGAGGRVPDRPPPVPEGVAEGGAEGGLATEVDVAAGEAASNGASEATAAASTDGGAAATDAGMAAADAGAAGVDAAAAAGEAGEQRGSGNGAATAAE